jgi:hypothetical protein
MMIRGHMTCLTSGMLQGEQKAQEVGVVKGEMDVVPPA